MMKKLLALALTLILTLGLACPAWAAEEPADPLPENWWMDDVAPAEDDYVYTDPYEEYAAAHPEEFENLDPDALLAGWGYVERTPAEWFLAYEGEYGETLEEAVWKTYVGKRIKVEYNCAQAEEYRAKYPKEWAKFDADSYFESEWLGYSGDSLPDKAAYMARYNVLTEEEFVDDMFVMYVDDNRYTVGFEQDEYEMPEPTLTLYVNGVASGAALAAEAGVTYADADDLREIFGAETVPADKTGLLPVRATAEAAGWDVVWYDGGWRGVKQEVQLWDKTAYLSTLEEQFPKELAEFVPGSTANPETGLFAEKPTTSHQTAAVDLTRFSTLDGDETYTLTCEVDTTVGGGVMDVTLTFDVSQLLRLFPENALENVSQQGGFTVTQLRQFLKAGVMEFVIDYNTGEMAYNVPLLTLLDENLTGWQTIELPGYADLREEQQKKLSEMSWTKMVYQMLLEYAESSGAEAGLAQYNNVVSVLTVFLGKDRFATQGNKITYTLTTDVINEKMTALLLRGVADQLPEELPTLPFFKDFTLTMTVEGDTVKADFHARMDMEGISSAIQAVYGGYDSDFSRLGLFSGQMLKALDMDITSSSQGSPSRSTGQLDIHWNNVGKLSVRTTATQTGGKAPRTVEDVVK